MKPDARGQRLLERVVFSFTHDQSRRRILIGNDEPSENTKITVDFECIPHEMYTTRVWEQFGYTASDVDETVKKASTAHLYAHAVLYSEGGTKCAKKDATMCSTSIKCGMGAEGQTKFYQKKEVKNLLIERMTFSEGDSVLYPLPEPHTHTPHLPFVKHEQYEEMRGLVPEKEPSPIRKAHYETYLNMFGNTYVPVEKGSNHVTMYRVVPCEVNLEDRDRLVKKTLCTLPTIVTLQDEDEVVDYMLTEEAFHLLSALDQPSPKRRRV